MSKITIFLDTETTGLVRAAGTDLYFQPYMIEFCGILTEGKKCKIVDEYETLIICPVMLPPIITKITGISDADLIFAPEFLDVAKPIKKIIQAADIMVAQNLNFDMEIIRIAFARIRKKVVFPETLFCTIEQSMHFSGYRMTGNELANEATGKGIKGAHRARADVLAMIDYFKYIKDPANLPAFFTPRIGGKFYNPIKPWA